MTAAIPVDRLANTLLPQSAPSGALRRILESAGRGVKIYHINELNCVLHSRLAVRFWEKVAARAQRTGQFEVDVISRRFSGKIREADDPTAILPCRDSQAGLGAEDEPFPSIGSFGDLVNFSP
jgi:hypothetical protein